MIYSIYQKRESLKEVISDELLTVPDQSLPLATLLERAQRGQLDVANYFRAPDFDSDRDSFQVHGERPLDALDAVDQLSRLQPQTQPQTPPSSKPQTPPETPPETPPASPS